MNRDLATRNDRLTPTIRIDLDPADGRSSQTYRAATFILQEA